MSYQRLLYRIMGDRALLVELGDDIHPAVNRRVRELFITLQQHPIQGVIEAVPTYRSLMIIYDPLIVRLPVLKGKLEELTEIMNQAQIPEARKLEIPVCYGGEYGPDLEWVANYHDITPEEVIRLHTGPNYQVYMIGFTPGHPYIAELPKALVTPRRETPRTSVPRVSVGIGTNQTVIYPVESPGGMQIIGRTPLEVFIPERWPPTLLDMGDQVKFFPIKEEELAHWEREKPWKS
jgi:inhibitor of KinA